MDRFDSFLTQLYNTHNIEEAGEDLPMPPTGAETGGGAAPGGLGVPQPGAVAPAAAANPEPIAPEDNIDDNNEEPSALIPGKKIQLINSGIYFFKIDILLKYIDKLTNNNNNKEYYLTQIFELLSKYEIGFTIVENLLEITGINTEQQLNELEILSSNLAENSI